jgi:hypothetical protein
MSKKEAHIPPGFLGLKVKAPGAALLIILSKFGYLCNYPYWLEYVGRLNAATHFLDCPANSGNQLSRG